LDLTDYEFYKPYLLGRASESLWPAHTNCIKIPFKMWAQISRVNWVLNFHNK
jgi:hypothetical protein